MFCKYIKEYLKFFTKNYNLIRKDTQKFLHTLKISFPPQNSPRHLAVIIELNHNVEKYKKM